MKKFLVIFMFSSLLFSCSSGQVNDASFENKHSIIIENLNQSQDNLFTASNSWLVDEFVSSKDVIQYQDKAQGIIKGKGLAKIPSSDFGVGEKPVAFTISIEVKKNKCRLTFQGMRFEYPKGPNALANALLEAQVFQPSDFQDFKIWADTRGKSLESKLKSAKTDNW